MSAESETEGEKQFVLRELCSVDVEDEGEQEEEEGEACGGGRGGFRRRTECNENGIVRFPMHVLMLVETSAELEIYSSSIGL